MTNCNSLKLALLVMSVDQNIIK